MKLIVEMYVLTRWWDVKPSQHYPEPLRLLDLEADLDLDFISLSPDPSLPGSDPPDLDLDLDLDHSSFLKSQ